MVTGVGASRVKRKRDLFHAGPTRRTDWLPVGGYIRGSEEEQVQPGPVSQSSDEFDSSSEEDRSRSEWFGSEDNDDPDDTFAGAGSAFRRHHNPRGEVEHLDGLSVGDANDSNDLDDAFAGAVCKQCRRRLTLLLAALWPLRDAQEVWQMSAIDKKNFCNRSLSSFD